MSTTDSPTSIRDNSARQKSNAFHGKEKYERHGLEHVHGREEVIERVERLREHRAHLIVRCREKEGVDEDEHRDCAHEARVHHDVINKRAVPVGVRPSRPAARARFHDGELYRNPFHLLTLVDEDADDEVAEEERANDDEKPRVDAGEATRPLGARSLEGLVRVRQQVQVVGPHLGGQHLEQDEHGVHSVVKVADDRVHPQLTGREACGLVLRVRLWYRRERPISVAGQAHDCGNTTAVGGRAH
eukprot:scaffold187676_cov26-Tisochrysis_lutea.AAC.5